MDMDKSPTCNKKRTLSTCLLSYNYLFGVVTPPRLKKTHRFVVHGRCHVVNSPPIFGIERKCNFRTASRTAQFSNIFSSFSVLSAESEAFENVMLPFAGAVNGPIEPREQRHRAHSLFAGLNKLSVFSPAHVYTRLRAPSYVSLTYRAMSDKRVEYKAGLGTKIRS